MPDFDAAHPPRKLRVFAFDPYIAGQYANRAIRELTITLPGEFHKTSLCGATSLDAAPRPFQGPVGEYLEVIDYDPSAKCFYAPVNFDDTAQLAQHGLAPDEADPRFHQQMVYAVAMATIVNFENALGRVALWDPKLTFDNDTANEYYVQRLRIYPHALREANAYYSSTRKALLFGYFEADNLDSAGGSSSGSGQTIFTCLSHDIIAHETCHALLDGIHPLFSERSTADMLALHEGFSDLVAILQHFSYPSVLEDQIARTRGNLSQRNLLGQLAQEFGHALGRGTALRDALGGMKDGHWQLNAPDPTTLSNVKGVHARGSILVAAVFRALMTIYDARTADLIRIASDGTGILRDGALHPDLVKRLAKEAAKAAEHMLQMCIRALDYCPPASVTFGDYLRAIITADHDLYPDDEWGYRAAIIEAFKDWGVVPNAMPVVTETTLLWPTLDELVSDNPKWAIGLSGDLGQLISNPMGMLKEMEDYPDLKKKKVIDDLNARATRIHELLKLQLKQMPGGARTTAASDAAEGLTRDELMSRNLLELGLEANREVEYEVGKFYALLFWGLFTNPANSIDGDGDIDALEMITGVVNGTLNDKVPTTMSWSKFTGKSAIRVQSVRMANRRGKRGQIEREYVVELVQKRHGFFDRGVQHAMDVEQNPPKGPRTGDRASDFAYRAGCTLLIDARNFRIRRVIRTHHTIRDDAGLDAQRDLLTGANNDAATAFFDPEDEAAHSSGHSHGETFANLHSHIEGE